MPRFLKFVAALGLLATLAGCSNQPVLPVPDATPTAAVVNASSALRPNAQPLPSTPSPEVLGQPTDPVLPTQVPLSDSLRPALLAGEAAREFERGGASWYGSGFHGRRTASGERYDMHALTAAHRTLPFGTLVRVHSLVNGREVDVRITDRGPFSRSRVIDVSRAAAEELGMLGLGFKEVVLLVPESVQPAAEAWPAPVRKNLRSSRRLLPPKPR